MTKTSLHRYLPPDLSLRAGQPSPKRPDTRVTTPRAQPTARPLRRRCLTSMRFSWRARPRRHCAGR